MSANVVLSILMRALLLIASGAGVFFAVFRRKGGFMNAGGILYYTIQSNLWVFLMTAVYFVLTVVSLFTGHMAAFRALEIIRFVILVGITITLLIFWLLLAPLLDNGYLHTMHNLLVHTLVPLLYIADFFLFDRIAPLTKLDVLWSMVMPLYYFVFTIAHAALNPKLCFLNGDRYPYFFMDVDKYGWFGFRKGLGVFWWALIFLGLTLGLGYFYRFLLSAV